MSWKDEHGVPAINLKKQESKTTKVINDDGTVGGTQTEHQDGRVDANVMLPTIGVKSKTMEGLE